MSKPLLPPTALLLCGVSSISPAQAAEHTYLQDQLVTATRSVQTTQQSLAAVTVFDRAQIEQSQATSVSELEESAGGVFRQQWRARQAHLAVHARQRIRPCLGPDRWHQDRFGHLRWRGLAGSAAGADRAHRGGTRAAVQPVWLGSHRRGDPDFRP